jgi:hypothetical protein
LRREVVKQVCHAQADQSFFGCFSILLFVQYQHQLHVFQNGQIRHQIVVLECKPNIPAAERRQRGARRDLLRDRLKNRKEQRQKS